MSECLTSIQNKYSYIHLLLLLSCHVGIHNMPDSAVLLLLLLLPLNWANKFCALTIVSANKENYRTNNMSM